MKNKFWLLILCLGFILPFVSSAHYIVGVVNDARDGTVANMHGIVLWNRINGVSDNLTDIIGPNGASHQDNMYLIDCELLDTPCTVGDELEIRVYNNGDNYFSSVLNLTVTGAGYDLVPNISLNSPVGFNSVLVDDSINLTLNEIDLLTNNTREVICEAILEEFDGESITHVFSEFFSEDSSFFGDSDDNNHHYTNSCSYDIWYYANSENWKCVINAADNLTNSTSEDQTFINGLLSIEVIDSLDFGAVASENISDEFEVVIYNRGNVVSDLSLSGYGVVEGDSYAMICNGGDNLNVDNKKYSFISNSGELSLSELELNYFNLTSLPFTNNFNLDYRQNDLFDDAFSSTYWRIYIPFGVGGSCQGNIIFGAVLST
jgi:hypothetical protein